MGEGEISAKGAGLIITSGILWGTVAIVVKVLVKTVDPSLIAFSRLLMGGVMISTIVVVRGMPVRETFNLRLVAIGGFGMAFNYLLYTIGLQYTLASAASMVVQSEVIFLVVLSVLLLNERFGARRILGMILALSGVVIISWNGRDIVGLLGSDYLMGNVIVFFAGFFWAIYAYSQKRLSSESGTLVSLSPILMISSLVLLPLAIPSWESVLDFGPWQIIALLYLGFICTGVSYIFLAEGLKRLPASIAGVLTTVMPITAVILANVLLREILTPYIIVGAFLDILGILLVLRGDG